MTAADIRRAIDRVSVWAGDVSADREHADQVVAAVRGLARVELFALLTAAGVECIRPRDTKAELLRRLHNRLTARVRCRERCEV